MNSRIIEKRHVLHELAIWALRCGQIPDGIFYLIAANGFYINEVFTKKKDLKAFYYNIIECCYIFGEYSPFIGQKPDIFYQYALWILSLVQDTAMSGLFKKKLSNPVIENSSSLSSTTKIDDSSESKQYPPKNSANALYWKGLWAMRGANNSEAKSFFTSAIQQWKINSEPENLIDIIYCLAMIGGMKKTMVMHLL